VQEKLFELGIIWPNNTKKINDNYWALFITPHGLTHSDKNVLYWNEHEYTPLSIDAIFNINTEKDIPKFDPKTLEPFQRVLVRSGNSFEWTLDLFSNYIPDSLYPFRTLHSSYKQCIPYNKKTKHLHLSTKNPSKYYITWKQ
jgi:hypothetical protein